jgi:uncharacterized protein YndB with AHSA1/START domain
MSETLATAPDGRTQLSIERRFPHPQEKVWRAVTQPEHLDQWFPFDVEVDLRVDGAMSFVDKRPDASTKLSGRVLELDPPRVFAFDWEGEVLRFDLEPDGDGTRLVFSHTINDHYGAASFTAGWTACLDALEDVLAARPVHAFDPQEMAATHDAFVEHFGLDEPVVYDGVLRFERQLTRANDVAWRQLVGEDEPVVGQPAPAGSTIARLGRTTVTAVEPGARLAYAFDGDGATGEVRIELTDGTGQGGRLKITQEGAIDRRDASIREWQTLIRALAERLRAVPVR